MRDILCAVEIISRRPQATLIGPPCMQVRTITAVILYAAATSKDLRLHTLALITTACHYDRRCHRVELPFFLHETLRIENGLYRQSSTLSVMADPWSTTAPFSLPAGHVTGVSMPGLEPTQSLLVCGEQSRFHSSAQLTSQQPSLVCLTSTVSFVNSQRLLTIHAVHESQPHSWLPSSMSCSCF